MQLRVPVHVKLSVSCACLVAILTLGGCGEDGGAAGVAGGTLEEKVKAAETARDALKKELEELKAKQAEAPGESFEAIFAKLKEDIEKMREENTRIDTEMAEYRKNFPLR